MTETARKKILKTLKTAVVFTTVLFYLSLFNDIKKHLKTKSTKTDTVYIYKEIPIYKEKYIPVEKTRYVPDLDTIVIKDTVEIVRDYYTAKTYTDTIKDSLFNVIIFDSISKNTILARRYSGSVRSTEKVVAKTIKNDKRVFAVGGGINYQNGVITPVLQIQSYKKNVGYNIALGYQNFGAGVVYCF